MKKILLYIAIVSWSWLVLYLLGSFIGASFDFRTWVPEGRAMLALLAGTAAMFAVFPLFA